MVKKIEGWIGRDISNVYFDSMCEDIEDTLHEYGDLERGKKKDWGDNEWPPKKVKITIEVEDDHTG